MGNKKKDQSRKMDCSRNWAFLLYPDNPKHVEIYEKVLKPQLYRSVYITHDKGLEADADSNKEHIHVMLFLHSERWRDPLANEFDLEPNLLQKLKSPVGYFVYCTHVDYKEKHQYTIDDFSGCRYWLKRFRNYWDKEVVVDDFRMNELIDYIDNYNGALRLMNFSRFCYEQNKGDLLTKRFSMFKALIEEHNFLWTRSHEISEGLRSSGLVE